MLFSFSTPYIGMDVVDMCDTKSTGDSIQMLVSIRSVQNHIDHLVDLSKPKQIFKEVPFARVEERR